jgi:hypothetical protein
MELFENHRSRHEKLLREVAEKHGVPPDLLNALIEYEKGRVHLQRRRGAKAEIQRTIEQHLEHQA